MAGRTAAEELYREPELKGQRPNIGKKIAAALGIPALVTGGFIAYKALTGDHEYRPAQYPVPTFKKIPDTRYADPKVIIADLEQGLNSGDFESVRPILRGLEDGWAEGNIHDFEVLDHREYADHHGEIVTLVIDVKYILNNKEYTATLHFDKYNGRLNFIGID